MNYSDAPENSGDPDAELIAQLDLMQTYAEEGRSLIIFTPPMDTGLDLLVSASQEIQIGG